MTEKMLERYSGMCEVNVPSLESRHDILVSVIPKIRMAVIQMVIKEYGHPLSKNMHLVFYNKQALYMSCVDYNQGRCLVSTRW